MDITCSEKLKESPSQQGINVILHRLERGCCWEWNLNYCFGGTQEPYSSKLKQSLNPSFKSIWIHHKFRLKYLIVMLFSPKAWKKVILELNTATFTWKLSGFSHWSSGARVNWHKWFCLHLWQSLFLFLNLVYANKYNLWTLTSTPIRAKGNCNTEHTNTENILNYVSTLQMWIY